MSRILVVYASYDGQTRRIAERAAQALRRAGHAVTVQPVAEAPQSIAEFDAVLVGGAIRYGHHDRALERWVAAGREEIAARPNAFFSVCMSAGGPGARPKTAQQYLDLFRKRTGWEPRALTSFAGACYYTRYNVFIRLMMRLIMGMAGGETDMSRDYEYTDWQAVDAFAGQFAEQARTPAAEAALA